jgi:hypothetical protein
LADTSSTTLLLKLLKHSETVALNRPDGSLEFVGLIYQGIVKLRIFTFQASVKLGRYVSESIQTILKDFLYAYNIKLSMSLMFAAPPPFRICEILK